MCRHLSLDFRCRSRLIAALGVDAVLDITLDATSVETSEIVNATFTFDKAVGDFDSGGCNRHDWRDKRGVDR